MPRLGFSIVVKAACLSDYSNWELNAESKYEVLDICNDDRDKWFLIADDNKDFVEIRGDHCKLGELDL